MRLKRPLVACVKLASRSRSLYSEDTPCVGTVKWDNHSERELSKRADAFPFFSRSKKSSAQALLDKIYRVQRNVCAILYRSDHLGRERAEHAHAKDVNDKGIAVLLPTVLKELRRVGDEIKRTTAHVVKRRGACE